MNKKKNNKQDSKVIIMTVAIAVVALLVGFLGRSLYDNRQDSKATDVGNSVVNSLVTGEVGDAYDLTSSGLRENQTEEEFVASMSGLKAEDPYMIDPIILKGGGKVMYERYVENLPTNEFGGTSANFQITLVKEGNNWRASNIIVR